MPHRYGYWSRVARRHTKSSMLHHVTGPDDVNLTRGERLVSPTPSVQVQRVGTLVAVATDAWPLLTMLPGIIYKMVHRGDTRDSSF